MPALKAYILAVTCALVLLLPAVRAVSAQEQAAAAADIDAVVELSDAEARRAEGLVNSMMSPFCPGRTLAGCPSPNAGVWRQEIRLWVKEGLSDAQIHERLASRVPGFNLAGSPGSPIGRWLAVLLAAGAISLLIFILRRMVKNQRLTEQETRGPEKASTEDDNLDTRLDRELDALR